MLRWLELEPDLPGTTASVETMDERLTPERLLAETIWLRGLAWTLVRDPDPANDLHRETMLTALRRHGTRTRRLPPWPAGIANKLAVDGVRAAARERCRLERVARDETAPGTLDVVVEFTTQRLVVDAVADLQEPYRSAVLLRFFEGLPPRDIAARLGIPVETVRTRLKRGLAALRVRLDAEFGDRESWRTALSALPLPDAPPGSPVWRIALPLALLASLGVGWSVFRETLHLTLSR
jgi:RNA polymerase sigma factor (sigma-70 family)